jgi:AcrR family transcriptional regulator
VFQDTAAKASATELRILQNALRHFCDFGYNGTSVREITAASEVTKPTLYYYFKNKEELFARLAQICFDQVLKSIGKAAERETTFEGAVRAIFQTYEEVFAKDPGALRFIYSITVSPQRGTPDVGVKEFIKKVDGYIHEIVGKAARNGECVEAKSEVAKVMLTALFDFHTMSLMMGGDEFRAQKKIQPAISAFLSFSRSAV